MKKYYLFFVAAAIALVFLVACSQANMRDDVPVSDLCEAVGEAVDTSSMVEMEDSYIKGAMKMDLSPFSEYAVYINAYGANIDEFGIFKAADKDSLKTAQQAVEDYLQLRRDTWMTEYMPEEKPKLDAAVAKVTGNYVMYAIFDEETCISAFSAFENTLTKK